MATLIQNGNNYSGYVQTWQIKDESELENLWQAAPGSVAFINSPNAAPLSKMWMKDNEGNWNEM